MTDNAPWQCPRCLEDTLISHSEPKTVPVRGIEVSVVRVCRRCTKCALDVENTQDHDWRVDAFDAYREKMGIASRHDMRAWREAKALNVEEAATLFGLSALSLSRLERGSLIDEPEKGLFAEVLARD